jgi:hypothetical protein
MKRILAAAVFTLALAGCGESPTQLCKDSTATLCKRVFECYDSATKQDPTFIATFGASETECNSKWNANQCATVTDSNPCQDSSKKYDSAKAQACINDLKAASCATITGGTFSSANCDNTCS